MAHKIEGVYCRGDLVFAKVRGHPPWPAKVEGFVSRSSKEVKYSVLFFGKFERAICKEDDLFHFEGHKSKYGKSRRRGFEEAFRQIEEAARECSSAESPEATPNKRMKIMQSSETPVEGSLSSPSCSKSVVSINPHNCLIKEEPTEFEENWHCKIKQEWLSPFSVVTENDGADTRGVHDLNVEEEPTEFEENWHRKIKQEQLSPFSVVTENDGADTRGVHDLNVEVPMNLPGSSVIEESIEIQENWQYGIKDEPMAMDTEYDESGGHDINVEVGMCPSDSLRMEESIKFDENRQCEIHHEPVYFLSMNNENDSSDESSDIDIETISVADDAALIADLRRKVHLLESRNRNLEELLDQALNAKEAENDDEDPLIKAVVRPWPISGDKVRGCLPRTGARSYHTSQPAGVLENKSATVTKQAVLCASNVPAVTSESSVPSTSVASPSSCLKHSPSTSCSTGHVNASLPSTSGRPPSNLSKALYEAAEAGNAQDVIKLITEGAHVNYREKSVRETPLHAAAGKGHTQVVALLIEFGARLNVVDKEGDTPLHLAASWGHTFCVEKLIKAGASVNIRDSDGDTPLHLAAYSGTIGCVRALLNGGADRHAENQLGEIPLDLAQDDSTRNLL